MARRDKSYKDKFGRDVKQIHNGNTSFRKGFGLDTLEASKQGNGKFEQYRSTTLYSNGSETPVNFGSVRAGKTAAQVDAQLKRIRENAAYLKERDGANFSFLDDDISDDKRNRQSQIDSRIKRAAHTARAFNDYHSLAPTAAKGNSVH